MLYTIIYVFMWRDLRLRGAEKEVFAVIYGFWKKGKAAVEVPVKTVMDITGLGQPERLSSVWLGLKRPLHYFQNLHLGQLVNSEELQLGRRMENIAGLPEASLLDLGLRTRADILGRSAELEDVGALVGYKG